MGLVDRDRQYNNSMYRTDLRSFSDRRKLLNICCQSNVPGQRRQITFASPPRSLNRPLH
ncbi:MAG: hypothetical protein KME17_06085 [Cyanosarcina radialis HA8281-LM2]|nr:hypothetical protein [Cyanosarcina radialis HA8281-LM2]